MRRWVVLFLTLPVIGFLTASDNTSLVGGREPTASVPTFDAGPIQKIDASQTGTIHKASDSAEPAPSALVRDNEFPPSTMGQTNPPTSNGNPSISFSRSHVAKSFDAGAPDPVKAESSGFQVDDVMPGPGQDRTAFPASTNSGPTLAQAPAGKTPITSVPKSMASSPDQPPEVDESALRYFARQGDARRLEAEIARLRSLYPNWAPPQDPFNIPQVSDSELDRIWKLYSEGRYAEVRQAVAERQKREPNWQPPSDLLDRLNVAESRIRLVNASELQQYDTVIRVATETTSLLTCSEVDVLWRVARAFLKTERPSRALDVYRYILTNCSDPGERLATMQMAEQQLERPALDELMSLERSGRESTGEFASVRVDLARKGVAAAGDDAKIKASGEDLQTVRRLADANGDASDSMLLGWYYLRHDDPASAEEWFKKSRKDKNSSESSQGLALALLAQSQPVEAEKVMRPWVDESDAARKVYVAATANLLAVEPPIIQPTDVLKKMVDAVARLRDANAARQLGWYSYALNQFATAGQWFAVTLDWKPDDEVAAFGLSLTSQRLGDDKTLARLKAVWAGRSPRIVTIGKSTVERANAAVKATEAMAENFGRPTISNSAPGGSAEVRGNTEALAYANGAEGAQRQGRAGRMSSNTGQASGTRGPASCHNSIDPRTLSPQAALNRGWCLMDLNRPLEAALSFEVGLLSNARNVRQDAAYGQSLAYLRAGLADKAAVSAAKQPQSSKRRVELATALLSAQAVDSFELKRPVETIQALEERSRIAPDRIDLLILRGYAYLELRRYGDAEKVFAAAAATGSSEGARGVNAVREATGYYVSSD